MLCSALFVTLCAAYDPAPLPVVTVSTDNTTIDRSCRVRIPPGTVIEDADNNGVIQIVASDIRVEFEAGSRLRGASPDTPPDQYRGFGMRIVGQKNVRLVGLRVSGFKAGLWATQCDGLVIEDADVSDNFRQHLRSTPEAEDSADWLWPHENDDNQWLTRYGAGIYIEDSDGVTVRRCRARNGQNGLVLDRVNDAKIYDNDFSFLSGWGIAMWRSSRNVLTRNSVDFCIRGYSHGVYNRGQDSAGFLVFEQCSDNIFAENSATHCGDGFFGFAGKEALGEVGRHEPGWYHRRGCNNNLLVNNDFSYAAAHGIEMTFSFGNRFIRNRVTGNAICGVWGGYSQDTLIAWNTFTENGDAGYGLERGGVDIEHGRGNRIVYNSFFRNAVGVHLWWDDEGDFASKPWGSANGTESTQNIVAFNRFENDKLAMQFRGPSDVTVAGNVFVEIEKQIAAEPQAVVEHPEHFELPPPPIPDYPRLGQRRALGLRRALAGRQNIIMTAWGPWDHESPLVRLRSGGGRTHVYELFKLPAGVEIALRGDQVAGRREEPVQEGPARYVVSAKADGVHAYTLTVRAPGFERIFRGTLVATNWQATFFAWPKDLDPRKKLAAWRKLAQSPTARTVQLDGLSLKYGFGGPATVIGPLKDSGIGGDHFGMIARTTMPLPAGRWRFRTLSDDGVRVRVNGKPVIENWTWHGPTRDEGVFEQPADGTVEIIVEHFEIDGYAVLELEITPVTAAP